MSNEQKLREALRELMSIVSIHQKATGNNFAWAEMDFAREALATTEPTSKQPLQVEPVANQQLTTEPVDEREAFESEMRSRHGWNNSYFTQSNDGGYLSNRATHAYIGWQARAAMAQVSDINVVESFTNDTKDAARYRWLASSESNAMDAKSQSHQWAISDAWTTLEKPDADKALIDAAIDAAMAQGVKG